MFLLRCKLVISTTFLNKQIDACSSHFMQETLCIVLLLQKKTQPKTPIAAGDDDGHRNRSQAHHRRSLSPQQQLSLSLHSSTFQRHCRPPQVTIFDAATTGRTTSAFSIHRHRLLKFSPWSARRYYAHELIHVHSSAALST